MDLAKILADLREGGALQAEVSQDGPDRYCIKVVLGRLPPVPLVVDKQGVPINLDAGMGPLERDPLGEDDAPEKDPIYESSFKASDAG